MASDLGYLLDLPRFADQGAVAYQPGLARIRALLEGMGNPHLSYRICHVGGTNGKGSTASMVAAILTASGLRTGLHTSPHLLHVSERMRVDGVPADAAWLEEAVVRYRPLLDRVGPSFFEATVALSLCYFAERDVDAAVVEVGLGGRLDATNVVTPAVTVITNVGLEHIEILGDTIEQIAAEKAGIVKPGVPVVNGVSQPGAARVIATVASQASAPLLTLAGAVIGVDSREQGTFTFKTRRADYGQIELDLPGVHQARNAALAILAVEQFLEEVDAAAVRRGLEHMRSLSGLRGRLEYLGRHPTVIVDVAHNPEGIAVALDHVAHLPREETLGIVLAVMKDKDVAAIAKILRPVDCSIRLPPIDAERAISPDDLKWRLGEQAVRSEVATDLLDAMSSLSESSRILIVGSHLLAAQALKELMD